MSRKMLRFRNEKGDLVRVFYKDGECKTQKNLELVLNGGYSWEAIKLSGKNSPAPYVKSKTKQQNANNPEFLGIQNPARQTQTQTKEKEGEIMTNTIDTPKRTRKASAVTPEVVEKLKGLSTTHTTKEAAVSLGLSYSLVYATAKEQGITFKVGQRGRKKAQ